MFSCLNGTYLINIPSLSFSGTMCSFSTQVDHRGHYLDSGLAMHPLSWRVFGVYRTLHSTSGSGFLPQEVNRLPRSYSQGHGCKWASCTDNVPADTAHTLTEFSHPFFKKKFIKNYWENIWSGIAFQIWLVLVTGKDAWSLSIPG